MQRKIIVMLALIALLICNFLPILNGSSSTSTEVKEGLNKQDNLQLFNSRYLYILGCQSIQTVQVKETLVGGNREGTELFSLLENGKSSHISVTSKLQIDNNIINSTGNNYKYEAKITFSNGTKFFIQESKITNTCLNGTQETIETDITGGFNYHLLTVDFTLKNETIAEKHRNATVAYSNSTTNYHVHSKGIGYWEISTNSLISGWFDVDQNITGKSASGLYRVDYAVTSDEEKIKFNLTRPDGKVIDPWWNGIFQYRVPMFFLSGFVLSWEPSEMTIPEAITVGGGLMLQILNSWPGVALLLEVIGAEMWYADQYVSDMGGYDVMNFYVETVTSGITPLVAEMGFYTNQAWDQPLPDWTYWPTWGIPYAGPHTCLWPIPFPDPPITFQSYDHSTSTYFQGVPIFIDEFQVCLTPSTYDFYSGTYTIEVPSYGSFAYYDIGGTIVYDNPASFTLGEQAIVITAHYNSRPLVSLTVDAYDGYLSYPLQPNVYLDGNWIGTAPISTQITMDGHTLIIDDPTFSDQWYNDIYLNYITGNYVGYCSGNMLSIIANSETTIHAVYWPPF